MPRVDVVEPFLEQHVERLAQSVEQRERGRVREVARGVRLDLVAEVEEDARQLCTLATRKRLLAHADQAEPCGSMKPFCDPVIARSTPQSSMRNSRLPTELTPST